MVLRVIQKDVLSIFKRKPLSARRHCAAANLYFHLWRVHDILEPLCLFAETGYCVIDIGLSVEIHDFDHSLTELSAFAANVIEQQKAFAKQSAQANTIEPDRGAPERGFPAARGVGELDGLSSCLHPFQQKVHS